MTPPMFEKDDMPVLGKALAVVGPDTEPAWGEE